jgi:signal peptidase I
LEAPPAEPIAPRPAEVRVRKARHGWLSSLQSLATTVVIAVFVITFIVQAFQIPSESMENTLLIGDYLLVDKVHYSNGGIWGHILPYSEIHRGEIVVFRYPVHPSQHFVKRVVGVPGDHVRLIDKQVFVNGKPVREPYVVFHSPIPDAYRDDFPAPNYVSANVEARWWLEMRKVVRNGELIVPNDMYFVMGDNRDESLDSRYWGFVPRENVIGRPLVIYWSFRREDSDEEASGADGRLSKLASVFVRLYNDTRWDRTLRLVR